jgi:predicted N-acyltransferase
MPALEIDITVAASIADVTPAQWDHLVSDQDPFLEHAFLSALEHSGSVGADKGCVPVFVLARVSGCLVGAVPLYLKTHSFGEYIFDWAWADAAERAGIAYYPKLVAAVSYTPSTGQRILTAPGTDRQTVVAALLDAVQRFADEVGASSVHFLFCTAAEMSMLAEVRPARYEPRLSMQFHWENRQVLPYETFEDYLSDFRARNRKQVRKERAIAASHGLTFKTAPGSELSSEDWDALTRFYSSNIERHHGIEYLQPSFFEIIRETLKHRIVATLAYRGKEPVAGTLNFEKGTRLYGRYWGCTENLDMLHFELCYYRLIERAIERRYTRFEAGAQGEHKLKRGLLPRLTYSAHWIRHSQLGAVIGKFLKSEAAMINQRVAAYAAHSPFRKEGD